MDKIRLLIVSGDSSAGRGLSAIFTSENSFDLLGNFSIDEAKDQSILHQPDVVLLDISDGITKYTQIIKQIKNECPCSLIIALIGNDQYESLSEMLSNGIDGCVTKGIMRNCLLKIVELVCRTGIFCMPGFFKKMVSFNKTVHISNFKNAFPARWEALTRREMEILHLMASNYSNREIAGKLFISEPTVKTHVSNILRKLGQSNRAQAIVFSYKVGLINDAMVVS